MSAVNRSDLPVVIQNTKKHTNQHQRTLSDNGKKQQVSCLEDIKHSWLTVEQVVKDTQL